MVTTKRRTNVYGEDITLETVGSIPVDGGENDQEQELELDDIQDEEVPEAFIPEFNVVPDDVPIAQQVPDSVPSEEEKKRTIDALLGVLGLDKAREFIQQPILPITPEKEQFVQDSAELAANLTSSIATWVIVLIVGIEYQELAPTKEEAENIERPIMNIIARHSKTVQQISPDWIDLSNFGRAFSSYTANMMETFKAIQDEKRGIDATGNERLRNIRTRQARASSPGVRPSNNGGYNGVPYNQEPDESTNSVGETIAYPNDNLTDYERYNFEQLSSLSKRDLEHRMRKSGRI